MESNQQMDCAQIRTVERRYIIQPRDYKKYTEDQLREHVPYNQLCVFETPILNPRVIDIDDDGRLNLYRTNENDLKNKKYPYCIIQCQRERISNNEKNMRRRYPNATLICSSDPPNAGCMFLVLKERAKHENIGLIFDKTSFYIDKSYNTTIDDVITLIRSLEHTYEDFL